MSKPNLSRIMASIQTGLVKHSPEILTGIGIAGMVTSTILAVRATPAALILIQDAEIRKQDKQVQEGMEPDELDCALTPVEVIKETWKCYIPAAASATISIVCLIGANSVNARRHAALATAYSLSETALKEYQDKVIETIGPKKEQGVRDAIAKDQLDKNPVSTREVVVTEKGNTRCFDALSGRYFTSDIDQLRKIENELNRRMRDEMDISLNDFYYEIGLAPTELGQYMGWNIDKGYIDLYFSAQLDEEDKPCLVVGHHTRPDYRYR